MSKSLESFFAGLRLTGLIGLITWTAGSAAAVTIANSVSVTSGRAGAGHCSDGPVTVSDSGSGDLNVSYSNERGGCRVEATSYIAGGVIGIGGVISQSPGAQNGQMGVRASAHHQIFGLTLEAAEGFTLSGLIQQYGNTVQIGLNAGVIGAVETSMDATGVAFVRGAAAELSGGITLRSGSNSDSVLLGVDVDVNNVFDGPVASESGELLLPRTPQITMDVGDTFRVSFLLNGSGNADGFSDSFASASFSSLQSVGFSSTGPAFILPEGFTVNAPEVNIIDNRWIDPRPVPEPTSLLLMLAGLGGLAQLGDRRSV